MLSIDSVGLRLRVLVARPELDDELANGADPATSPALRLRAAQLCRPAYRRHLAVGVERLVKEADSGQVMMSAALPFQHAQVKVARDALLTLAQALRSADWVHPRGIALVKRLLGDPTSALYARTASGALELQAQVARDYLLSENGVSTGFR